MDMDETRKGQTVGRTYNPQRRIPRKPRVAAVIGVIIHCSSSQLGLAVEQGSATGFAHVLHTSLEQYAERLNTTFRWCLRQALERLRNDL